MAILEPLSYKQQKFCEEYLLSFNAYRAALTAGYTDNTARKGDLLHVPKIQAYLKQAMSRSAARAELTHDMLLRELMKVAFCNMGNYYDDHGDPKRMHQLTDDERAALSYFERKDIAEGDDYVKGEVFKIKLHNKMAAIDKLCKHTGFYKANWKPLADVDRSETEEDIAFEAECANAQVEGYSEEVTNELFEQMGMLSEEVEDVEEALQTQDHIKHSLQTSATGMEEVLSCEPAEDFEEALQTSATGAVVNDDAVDNILTLTPLAAESKSHPSTATIGRWAPISAAGRLKEMAYGG